MFCSREFPLADIEMINTKKDGVSTRSTRLGTQESVTAGEEMTISQLANLLSSKLESTKSEIFRKIDNEMAIVRADIKTEMNSVRAELEKSIGELSSSVHHNKASIRLKNDAIARSRNVNDLIVSGVPYTQNENLPMFVAKWCQVLGYPENSTPLVDVRRISKLPLMSGKSYPILIQFAITNHRNDFYVKYLRTRSFTLEQIGFKSNGRMYVNENLTTADRALKAKALTAKKQGKLESVFTRNGIIYIRRTADGDRYQISSEDQLSEFLQS